MRIGVTGLRGIPQVMGGIESHCEELYPRLRALRPADEVFVIARSPYVPANPPLYKGIAIVPIPAVRNKYLETVLHTFLAVFVIRFRLRCDTIHFHGIGPALFAPLARLFGLKVIVTQHSANYDHSKWNSLARFAFRLGEACAVRFGNAVIVVSSALASKLLRRYPRRGGAITHITNGASLMPSPSSADGGEAVLREMGIERGGFILAVGRLVPEKGFGDLIEAFLASNSPLKLVIAGRADHEDDYSRALLAQAGPRLIFAGFQTHERLGVLYRDAAMFVLASHNEGMPLAALEAGAAGTPMLLSDIPANLEIGLYPSHYFPVGNVLALRMKLDQDPRDFAIDPGAIRSRYDWAKVAAATSAIYDRVSAA